MGESQARREAEHKARMVYYARRETEHPTKMANIDQNNARNEVEHQSRMEAIKQRKMQRPVEGTQHQSPLNPNGSSQSYYDAQKASLERLLAKEKAAQQNHYEWNSAFKQRVHDDLMTKCEKDRKRTGYGITHGNNWQRVKENNDWKIRNPYEKRSKSGSTRRTL